MPTEPQEQPGYCRRCGTCCVKGGPALHGDDRQLVQSGAIDLTDLFTIRKGEPVFDNVRKQTTLATGEIIKVKGRDGDPTCRFYDDSAHCCRMYTRRPLECRLLTCWDTAAIQAAYATDRLTRKDLVGHIKGLWDLITGHEDRCSYLDLGEQVRRLKDQRDRQAADQVFEAINFDNEMRQLLVKEQNVDPDGLDFLLGRPMGIIFPAFGYDIRREEGMVRFVPR